LFVLGLEGRSFDSILRPHQEYPQGRIVKKVWTFEFLVDRREIISGAREF